MKTVVTGLCLILLVLMLPSQAAVLVSSRNISHASRAASFGPAIPEEGFSALLIDIERYSPFSNLGCDVITPPNISSWIALVQRGNCSFIDKIRAMQSSGATGVIVGNNVPIYGLVTMFAPGDTSDVLIQSVFVSQSSYDALKALAQAQTEEVTLLQDDEDIPILEIVIIAVVTPSVVMFFLWIVWLFTEAYQRQLELAPTRAVLKLPKKIYEDRMSKDNDPTTCAICLEDFANGCELRILPCKHEFHVPCIDKWLLKRKRTCPICKQDACSPKDTTPLLLAIRTISAVATRVGSVTPTSPDSEAPPPQTTYGTYQSISVPNIVLEERQLAPVPIMRTGDSSNSQGTVNSSESPSTSRSIPDTSLKPSGSG